MELASRAEIVLIQRQWAKQQGQRYTVQPKAKPEKLKFPYTDSRQADLKRIAEEYKLSEEKRLNKRAKWRSVKAAGKEAEKAENERWDRIFRDKHEDKSYYGVRA